MYRSEMEPNTDFSEFPGMEAAFCNDAAAVFDTVVNRAGAVYDMARGAAHDKICGTAKPQVVVQEVVREVMVNHETAVPALVYGGLGVAAGYFASKVANSQVVGNTVSYAQERLAAIGHSDTANKYLDGAFSFAKGLVRKVRGTHRFHPYKRESPVNFVPIPLDNAAAARAGIPLSAVFYGDDWYTKCAKAIGCSPETWKREFIKAYHTEGIDSIGKACDVKMLFAECKMLKLPVHDLPAHQSEDKKLLRAFLVATDRIHMHNGHEVMEHAEQQPVPLEAFYLWEKWYADCAKAIGCHATEWEREFNLAYTVCDSVWEQLDEQQLLYASQSLSLPVNESMDKRLLVSCLIATTRIYDVDLFPK